MLAMEHWMGPSEDENRLDSQHQVKERKSTGCKGGEKYWSESGIYWSNLNSIYKKTC